jgi:hypothetical protein
MADREGIDNQALLRCVVLGAVGGVVMFVAHFLGLLGWMLTEGREMHPPYWWAYLVLYPIAAVTAMALSRIGWLQAALCVCATPVIYFFMLGVLDGDWLASDGAFGGSLLAVALTVLVAFFFRNRARGPIGPGASAR